MTTRRTSRPDGGGFGLLGGGGDPWTDGLLLAALAAVAVGVVGSAYWAAGGVLSLMTGNGGGPSLVNAATRVLGGTPPGRLWPGVSPWAVLVLGSAIVAASGGLGVVALSWWRDTHPGRDGYAGSRPLAVLLPGRTSQATARRLRPSLTGAVSARDRGLPLGVLSGSREVRATWEDVVLAICAPRSGKTTCLAVPAVSDAPGPVVATSNKPDLWQLTATVRGEVTGERVWTFDPQRITGYAQTFTWNPLSCVTSVGQARRLAGHFIQEIRPNPDRADFWDRDAEDLLTGLLLAAATAELSLTQVGAWLTATSTLEPRSILRDAGFAQLADTMTGRSQGAHETREGVYATARAAASCLADRDIMAWVAPQPGVDEFDPASFVRSRQTLYLLSKDGAGSAAPLVAAFADRVMLDAVAAAEHSPGARLDPPLVAVLDEAANICRIADLPRLYSHLGSRGVVPLTILQSRSQGRRVWGDTGMDELYSAATIKVIGAGVDDPGFAEDLSRLLGDEDITVLSRTTGKHGGTQTTTRRERVLAADEIRALPKFTALLLATGVRPARVRLVPWMDSPHAQAIRAAQRASVPQNR